MTDKGIELVHPPFRFSSCARAKNIDWFHIHWPGLLAESEHRLVLLAKQRKVLEVLERIKEKRVRLLWTMHNYLPHGSRFREQEIEFRKSIVTLCDLVHIHFPSAKSLLREQFGYRGRIVVVPHGSYQGWYGPAIEQSQARKQLGVPTEVFLFILLGRLRRNKNVEVALEAVKNLKPGRAFFLACGEPESRAYGKDLRRLIGNDPRIRLVGRKIKNREIPRFMSAADVFVLPARSYFTSGSAMLAITYGLPLIGRCENHLELFAQENLCFDWDASAVESLQTAMNEAMSVSLATRREHAKRLADQLRWEKVISPLVDELHRATR